MRFLIALFAILAVSTIALAQSQNYDEQFESSTCSLGHPACTIAHIQCAMGHMDCDKAHLKCRDCGTEDCEKEHYKCPNGHLDCEKTHEVCKHCGIEDCKKSHVTVAPRAASNSQPSGLSKAQVQAMIKEMIAQRRISEDHHYTEIARRTAAAQANTIQKALENKFKDDIATAKKEILASLTSEGGILERWDAEKFQGLLTWKEELTRNTGKEGEWGDVAWLHEKRNQLNTFLNKMAARYGNEEEFFKKLEGFDKRISILEGMGKLDLLHQVLIYVALGVALLAVLFARGAAKKAAAALAATAPATAPGPAPAHAPGPGPAAGALGPAPSINNVNPASFAEGGGEGFFVEATDLDNPVVLFRRAGNPDLLAAGLTSQFLGVTAQTVRFPEPGDWDVIIRNSDGQESAPFTVTVT